MPLFYDRGPRDTRNTSNAEKKKLLADVSTSQCRISLSADMAIAGDLALEGWANILVVKIITFSTNWTKILPENKKYTHKYMLRYKKLYEKTFMKTNLWTNIYEKNS